MNKIKEIFIPVLIFVCSVAFGQESIQKAEVPYIEVNGTAENEVIPDEIHIGIVIRERYVSREKVSIEAQEEKLKNALISLGIDLENLFLSDANADYVKIRWQKKDVITKKDYTLKVSNATEVGQVFQELEKMEITDAFISKVEHSKIDSLRKEIKILAIKDAKAKADYLLEAIGEKTGKPLIINESSGGGTVTSEQIRRAPLRSAESYDANVIVQNKESVNNNDIQFRKIKLVSNIYVKFSIK